MVACAQTELTQSLTLLEIERDTATQQRVALDPAKVEEYGERWKEGSLPPPIVVFYDGKHYWLADGWHRFSAAEWAGKKSIVCVIREGTKEDAIRFACGANAKHGVAMTDDDKRKCVETMLRLCPDWAGRRIADHVGCSEAWVRKIREQLRTSAQLTNGGPSLAEQFEKRIGRDGKARSMPQKARPAAQPAPSDDELDAMVDDLDDDDELGIVGRHKAEIIDDWVKRIDKLQRELKAAESDWESWYGFIPPANLFSERAKSLKVMIANSRPVGRCTFCDGTGKSRRDRNTKDGEKCRRCSGTALMNKAQKKDIDNGGSTDWPQY